MVIAPTYSKKQVNRAGKLLRGLTKPEHLSAVGEDELWRAVEIVEWWRAEHARPLARTNANLRYYVRKVDAEISVTQRLKRFSTIVDKLRRQPTMQLSTMEDIGGVRAVLDTQRHVDRVVDDLHGQTRWKIRRVREYITDRDPGPKPDGYRAVHLVVEKDDRYIEIQFRTPWQDRWAQSVEQDTRRLRAGLKFGAGPADLREYYRVIAEYLEWRERNEEPPQELLEELTKLFDATSGYYPGRGASE